MLHAWRITKAKFAATAFSGLGAKQNGGRWNSPGTALVYSAATTSLALLEIFVHVRSQSLLAKYVLFQIFFDESLVCEISPAALPKNWRNSRPPHSLALLGDQWVNSSRHPILRVPSSIVPHESNYLLNPAHPHFQKIRIGPKTPIRFDGRLLPPQN